MYASALKGIMDKRTRAVPTMPLVENFIVTTRKKKVSDLPFCFFEMEKVRQICRENNLKLCVE